MNTKPILIIGGEPYSIFSEIFFKSIMSYKSKNPIILIASLKLFKEQMTRLGYNFEFNELSKNFDLNKINKHKINIIDVKFKFKNCFSKISNSSKNYIKDSFKIALDLSNRIKVMGIINGPVSKKHFLDQKTPGITEYLSKKTNSKNCTMLIYSKNFSVSPVTTHVSLKDVSKKISKKKIINSINNIKIFYKKHLNKNARICITGLNPHCESKSIKNEENLIIIPAIKYLKKKYKFIYGPLSADSLFMRNNLNKFDVVLGMYHDQVLTPAKAINDFKAINITLGLPFVRISPDHGPNNLMLGKNISNPTSLIESIKFLN